MTYRHSSGGKRISLLGYGSMRLPTVDGRHANQWGDGVPSAAIDQNLLNEQVRRLLDAGVNYFDTSPAYCRGESERCLGEALAKSGYDRRDYFIATKISNFAEVQYPLDACKRMFETSLKLLHTDYIDCEKTSAVGFFSVLAASPFARGFAIMRCVSESIRDKEYMRNFVCLSFGAAAAALTFSSSAVELTLTKPDKNSAVFFVTFEL